ncbi:MAG: DNA ligase D [Cellvibrio sp.]|uniref:DNA ligase D n=1 Tax=Cellvibrio sp. TaxID=1965322 RepID=UPI002720A1B1|nr:DNA ligase D [Cellvibrio sp.]
MARPISEYTKKRNFDITSEPAEERAAGMHVGHALRFVIQKHDASHLHYDFRLEMNGTLKSWAVPKGPSLDPKDKRLAVHVEDHPISYAKFEGSIPKGQYGGGDVIVWDEGIWKPHGDANAAYQSGKLKFSLVGEKLGGDWALVKTRLRGSGDKEQWLLIKEKDETARSIEEYDIVKARPESVITGELLPVDKNGTGKPASTKRPVKASTDPERKTAPPAKKITSIPESFSPQLATLVSEPPTGEWVYEIKFDGYRMLARVINGKVNFFTRNGHDWTSKLPHLIKPIEALKLKDSWFDGELVVLNEHGLPNFQALQNAFDSGRSQDIIYYLFDAPYLNGEDIRNLPVEERRSLVEKIIPRRSKPLLRYSANFDADHHSIVESACAMSLEGVIGKRIGSTYVSRRSEDWIKLKCRLRQEFVIIGYTEPKGSRSGFGAILLGIHKAMDSSDLLYAGRVGTGFNTDRLTDIYKKMHALERATAPVSSKLTGQQHRGVHWINPKLVCEVEFTEWTSEGILRQASFISLRTDKPAKDIIREQPRTLGQSKDKLPVKKSSGSTKVNDSAPAESIPIKSGKVTVAGVNISHPERIIDSESGGTKLDLALFYESVADLIAPHLKDRPVSLLRVPDGIGGEQFFQKHSENRAIPHVTQLDTALDPDHAPLMALENVSALLGCVQMNSIEFHTWGATTENIELPDRFVLDLDPDPALPWRSVTEAAHLTLAVLDELKLKAFLKTTGGKGIHIIVPLTPNADWPTVKAFSKAIAEFMAKQIPERFVAKMGPQNRIGKIFIDYLRNSRGASTVSAYSVRARPGLPISVPIAREELSQITRPDQWNIGNFHERLKKLKDNPWGIYSGAKYRKSQKITSAMWKKLGLSKQ